MSLLRVADLGAVIRGVSWDRTEASDVPMPGLLPVLRAGNIADRLDTDDDLVWIPASNVSATQILRAGDIAICMSSGSASIVGKTAISQAAWNGSVGAFCAILRADPAICLPEYLAFYLKSPRFRSWTSEAQGANIKNIKKSALEDFKIDLPSLAEQRRIVDILSRAESIVRLRREAQQKAAELVPAIFLDMFGDPATNPKGWPVAPLKDIASFVSGGTPSKANENYWKGDLPWVSPKDMKRMAIDDAIDHINPRVITETSLKLIPVGAVLLVVRGMILVHSVPVAKALVPLTINQDMKALTSISRVQTDYLLWLFKVSEQRLLGMVETAAHGTKKLETPDLEKLMVPIPPEALQQEFARRVEAVNSICGEQGLAAFRADMTFKSLLGRCFEGKLLNKSTDRAVPR